MRIPNVMSSPGFTPRKVTMLTKSSFSLVRRRSRVTVPPSGR
jgi:hypothetical protein